MGVARRTSQRGCWNSGDDQEQVWRLCLWWSSWECVAWACSRGGIGVVSEVEGVDEEVGFRMDRCVEGVHNLWRCFSCSSSEGVGWELLVLRVLVWE
jgi:hypothetical protein